LKIAHCAKQKNYIFWKYESLKRLAQTTAAPKRKFQKKKGKIYEYFEFYLTSGTYLKRFHSLFYYPELNSEGKISYIKKITPELLAALPKNPALLAILFLDDGSIRNDAYSGKLAFQGFSKEEQELFQTWLLETWGIQTTIAISSREKNQYYLSIPAAFFGKFANIIEPTIKEIPDMEYKLNQNRKYLARKTSND